MKKQSYKSHMHEHEAMMHHDHGHIHHHLKAEHKRHGSAPYEHETDHPHIPPKGKNAMMGPVDDFKGDSMDTAYGQAGKHGCQADQKKIHSQFKSYGWDANTGY